MTIYIVLKQPHDDSDFPDIHDSTHTDFFAACRRCFELTYPRQSLILGIDGKQCQRLVFFKPDIDEKGDVWFGIFYAPTPYQSPAILQKDNFVCYERMAGSERIGYIEVVSMKFREPPPSEPEVRYYVNGHWFDPDELTPILYEKYQAILEPESAEEVSE